MAGAKNQVGLLRNSYDVVVCGGGMAGIGLAIQLKQASPEATILVVERRRDPAPEAAYKVGESLAEVASDYFARVLGMKEHLASEQIRKFGLRYFFSAGDNSDIARRPEFGPIDYSAIATYQCDRGRLENAMVERAASVGVVFREGSNVSDLELGPEGHRVQIDTRGEVAEVTGRWLVDASGRRGLLKRKLGLAEKVGHSSSACWFRIRDRIAVDEWSDDPQFRSRTKRARWTGTVQLLGPGYWVWLIPLSSGSHSVGVVADSDRHPLHELSSFEKTLAWLSRHEPQCAREVERRRDSLQDFRVLDHYAYGCKQVFSPDRWALTGEAGVFLDPLYSIGSDFIALANSYITDFISRDLRGETVGTLVERADAMFLYSFKTALTLFEGQYPMMGHAQAYEYKAFIDTFGYWGVFGLISRHGKWTDPEFMAEILPLFLRYREVLMYAQEVLRRWASEAPQEYAPAFRSFQQLAFAKQRQDDLILELDDQALKLRLAENVDAFEQVVRELTEQAPCPPEPFEWRPLPSSDEITDQLALLRLQPALSVAAGNP